MHDNRAERLQEQQQQLCFIQSSYEAGKTSKLLLVVKSCHVNAKRKPHEFGFGSVIMRKIPAAIANRLFCRLSVEPYWYCRLPPSVLLPVAFRSTPSRPGCCCQDSAFAFLTVCYATRHFGMPTGILQTLQSILLVEWKKMLSDRERGSVGPLHLRPSLPLNDS